MGQQQLLLIILGIIVVGVAIAIAITAFNPTVALATVIGPLIEVPVMLALVWFAKATEAKLFKTQQKEI